MRRNLMIAIVVTVLAVAVAAAAAWALSSNQPSPNPSASPSSTASASPSVSSLPTTAPTAIPSPTTPSPSVNPTGTTLPSASSVPTSSPISTPPNTAPPSTSPPLTTPPATTPPPPTTPPSTTPPGTKVTFDFDIGTAIPTLGQSTPFDYSSSGVTAHFSSPTDPAFYVTNRNVNTIIPPLTQFSGNLLYPSTASRASLDIKFSRSITSITLTFATIETHDPGVGGTGTPAKLTAYMDSTATQIGSPVTVNGIESTGGSYPQGTLSFTSTGQSFNLVRIEVPFINQGATSFLVDNISITTA